MIKFSSSDPPAVSIYLSFFLFWPHLYLSITPGSAHFEILTKKKKKNFWLNFWLNKEYPKLLCGLGIGHRRRQTVPKWNSSGEKGILQGITVCLVSAVFSTI